MPSNHRPTRNRGRWWTMVVRECWTVMVVLTLTAACLVIRPTFPGAVRVGDWEFELRTSSLMCWGNVAGSFGDGLCFMDLSYQEPRRSGNAIQLVWQFSVGCPLHWGSNSGVGLAIYYPPRKTSYVGYVYHW